MKGLHRTKIDYCRLSGELIGREGYVLNIVTGCKHGCEYCYARRMVEHGRLKGSPSYPYGFEPTFHPDHIRAIGGKPKLIFLNDMGDVGGNWNWRDNDSIQPLTWTTNQIVLAILNFAVLNHQHILLLLTKNPAWYALATWPENVWCGFSATNNEEFGERWTAIKKANIKQNRMWISFEPWLDADAPDIIACEYFDWIVIGGLSGRNPQGVSEDTLNCLKGLYEGQPRIFVKDNAGMDFESDNPIWEYPDSWKVPADV